MSSRRRPSTARATVFAEPMHEVQHQLDAVTDIKFIEQAAHVGANRRHFDTDFFGDLLIAPYTTVGNSRAGIQNGSLEGSHTDQSVGKGKSFSFAGEIFFELPLGKSDSLGRAFHPGSDGGYNRTNPLLLGLLDEIRSNHHTVERGYVEVTQGGW